MKAGARAALFGGRITKRSIYDYRKRIKKKKKDDNDDNDDIDDVVVVVVVVGVILLFFFLFGSRKEHVRTWTNACVSDANNVENGTERSKLLEVEEDGKSADMSGTHSLRHEVLHKSTVIHIVLYRNTIGTISKNKCGEWICTYSVYTWYTYLTHSSCFAYLIFHAVEILYCT